MNNIEENFRKWKPEIKKYSNGRAAIQYISFEDHGYPELECTATINLPNEYLEDDQVIIKDYSKNEGLYEIMLAAGHIGPKIKTVYSGFISSPVCKLLIK